SKGARCRDRRAGPASGCCRMRSSSGTAPTTACTSACCTKPMARAAGRGGCCTRERFASVAGMTGPRRIVCLTEEPTEVRYALGEQEIIVGISGLTVRPAIARREKPKVSAFTSAKIGEILKLQPDFVVGFSDIQADIAAELIRHGVEV